MITKKKILLGIGLLFTLMCGISGATDKVRVEKPAIGCEWHHDQVVAHVFGLPDSLLDGFRSQVLPSQGQQQIGSLSQLRIIPAHGGKSGKNLGHWINQLPYQHLSCICLPLIALNAYEGLGIASPRLYYVIALRRILC